MKLYLQNCCYKNNNYNILLRMTSENPEAIFQLIKDDIPNENTKLRELTRPGYNLQSGFLMAFY